jgi:hypothetical protein
MARSKELLTQIFVYIVKTNPQNINLAIETINESDILKIEVKL